MPDSAENNTCPTVVFGQLEMALRDNDFAEVEHLRQRLASMGIHVRIELWPPIVVDETGESEPRQEAAPCR